MLKNSPWIAESAWAKVTLAHKGKYLGVTIGPQATPEDTLCPVIDKMEKRMRTWAPLHPSLFVKIRIWNAEIATAHK